MTDWPQAVVLALVQGLTEFLPVSSAAHLILSTRLLGWPDQGLAFDVAVHVGSLLAVVAYFRRDLMELAHGCRDSVRQRRLLPPARMVCYLAVATIPAGLAGLLAADLVSTELRNTKVIAITTLLFGLLLGFADRRGSGDSGLSWRKVLWIGMAQALAILPGASRSGVTMTAALLCGLGRREAARFSFLLSIPIIAAAGLLQAVELSSSGAAVEWSLMLLATLLSALTAYVCVRWFIALIERVGFMPFVLYRVALGLLLIWTGW